MAAAALGCRSAPWMLLSRVSEATMGWRFLAPTTPLCRHLATVHGEFASIFVNVYASGGSISVPNQQEAAWLTQS